MRKAFGAALKQRTEKADAEQSGKGGDKGESARGGRGGEGAVRRRQRTRRRDQAREIEVPEDQAPVFETPPRDMLEPHWIELPLADKFHGAAQDCDDAGGESEACGRRIKPSRSARGNERDGDGKDFERER